jgi:uncharacterized protein YggE
MLLMSSMVLCRDLRAQEAGKGVVTVTGQATIKAQPDLMRITIELSGQGKDIKEALSKLAEEREMAKTKLAVLGVAPESIQIDDPAIGGVPAGSNAQAMVIAMMQGNRQAPAAPANQVRVSSRLETRLPLKAASAQDKLVEAVELMDKAKTLLQRKLSPQEQEIADEMQSQTPGQSRPGEPQFAFVHVITEVERDKATADAVAQAKQSAQRLAQAAGAKLGPVRQLSESATSGVSNPIEDYTAQYYSRILGMAGQSAAPAANEAVAMQPGPVTFVITVSIGYALE